MYPSSNLSSTTPSTSGAARSVPLPRDSRTIQHDIRTHAGQAYGTLDSVSGDITVAARARVRSVSTRSGDVTLGGQSLVGPVDTVSGDVRVTGQAIAASVETVSGDITLGMQAKVEGRVKSTSGDISAEHGCSISSDVETVSGRIALHGTTVDGDIHFVCADVTVDEGSHVRGKLHLHRPVNGMHGVPRVVIGADSRIEGEMVFEVPVSLFVHASAQTGPISGATRTVFCTPQPPQPAQSAQPGSLVRHGTYVSSSMCTIIQQGNQVTILRR